MNLRKLAEQSGLRVGRTKKSRTEFIVAYCLWSAEQPEWRERFHRFALHQTLYGPMDRRAYWHNQAAVKESEYVSHFREHIRKVRDARKVRMRSKRAVSGEGK